MISTIWVESVSVSIHPRHTKKITEEHIMCRGRTPAFSIVHSHSPIHTRSTIHTCCFSVFVPILFLRRIIEATTEMTYHRKSVWLAFYCTYISFNTLTIRSHPSLHSLLFNEPSNSYTCTTTRTHQLPCTIWLANKSPSCQQLTQKYFEYSKRENHRTITKMKQ